MEAPPWRWLTLRDQPSGKLGSSYMGPPCALVELVEVEAVEAVEAGGVPVPVRFRIWKSCGIL